MKLPFCVRTLKLLACLLGVLVFAEASAAQTPPPSPATSLPSESPAQFTPVTTSFDYVRRDVMIPMRDGVKLHTVILVPKSAKNEPILLTRTPYDATDTSASSRMSAASTVPKVTT
jgi:predicted acyl esterase